MRGIRAWFLRLRNFFSGARDAEKDFAAEMQSNLQLHIDENAAGEARYRNAGVHPEKRPDCSAPALRFAKQIEQLLPFLG